MTDFGRSGHNASAEEMRRTQKAFFFIIIQNKRICLVFEKFTNYTLTYQLKHIIIITVPVGTIK